MGFNDGFLGAVGGAVQTSYTDQPGQGVPGMLAMAHDLRLVDALVVVDANGVAAGKGVKATQETEIYSQELPNIGVLLPTGSESVADFEGVTVFDETMGTNSSGIPGMEAGRKIQVLRAKRGGGRIWVYAREAVVAGTSTVNWITTAGTVTSGAVYEAGEFSPAAAAGGTAVSTAISSAKWITSAAAGGVACIEFKINAA